MLKFNRKQALLPLLFPDETDIHGVDFGRKDELNPDNPRIGDNEFICFQLFLAS